MRPCLLGILLISLIGCPSPPVKNGGLTQTGDSTQKKKNLPSQSPKPTPPGPFPSLVTGDTFTHNTPETRTRPIAKVKVQPPVQAANKDQKPRGPTVRIGRGEAGLGGPTSSARAARVEMLAKLTDAWEKNPTSRLHLARLLNFLLLTDQPVTADKLIREKDALQGYDGKDFELNLALARLDRQLGRSAKAFSRLGKILDREKGLLPLSIEKALFAEGQVSTYGKQTRRSTNRYRPSGYFRVYLEVENFVLSGGGEEPYNVRFKIHLKIYTAGGEQFQWKDWLIPKVVKDTFRSHLRDIWMPITGYFPAKIPAGDYELIIELEDENKKENQRTVKRLPFVIVGS